MEDALKTGLGVRIKSDEHQRSFHFEQRITNEYRTVHGLLSYGMYGFESKIIDVVTGDQKYNRTITDLEEIPLYCQFWIPEGARHGYVIFQSFQGRSCNTLFMASLCKYFGNEFQNFFLGYEKLMPEQIIGLQGENVFVKELRLIKKKPSSDIVDRYLGAETSQVKEIELIMRPRRNSTLGSFARVRNIVKSKKNDGLLSYDGIDFEEASAQVEINGKRRVVGLLSPSNNTGVIDISEEVKFGEDGHPQFDSVAAISSQLLADFHAASSG